MDQELSNPHREVSWEDASLNLKDPATEVMVKFLSRLNWSYDNKYLIQDGRVPVKYHLNKHTLARSERAF